MTLDGAFSAFVSACLLGIAALLAANALRRSGKATRFAWLAAMLASVLLSVLPYSSFAPTNTSERQAASQPLIRDVPAVPLPPIRWSASPDSGPRETAEAAFKLIWVSLSTVMLGFLLFHEVQNRRRKKQWRRDSFHDERLYVSIDTGPAVVGFRRPAIVVPRWFCELPPSQRSLVLTHERAHIAARDPALLLAGFVTVALVPWNLPLWWMFVGLRRAIELDCDRRVLGGGADRYTYGETLIAVAERRSRTFGVALPSAGAPSLLRRRILVMSESASKVSRLTALFLIGAAGLIAVAAAQVRTSDAPADQARLVTVESAVLEQYVGEYSYSQTSVMHVTRSGDHLQVRFTGGGSDDIYPQSANTFFYVTPGVYASIEFSGQRAVLRQNGAETAMDRIDSAAAAKIESTVAERVAAQSQSPRSAQALQRLVAGIYAGKIDAGLVNSQLAGALRGDLPKLQVRLQQLGQPKSFAFQRVNGLGGDEYLVTHEQGTSEWSVVVDGKGMITGATIP